GVVPRVGFARENSQRVDQCGRTKLGRDQANSLEAVTALPRQPRGDFLMIRTKNTYRVALRLGKCLVTIRLLVQTPKHERRLERDRSERVDRDAHMVFGAGRCGHDRNARWKGAERGSERTQIEGHGVSHSVNRRWSILTVTLGEA